MVAEPELSLSDRVAFSFLGAITGALYGAVIALLLYFLTDQGHPKIVAWSAGVFGFLGIFYGNLIVEALLAVLHFLAGLLGAFSEQPAIIEAVEKLAPEGHLRTFLLVGFGTGTVIVLWSCF